LELKLPGGNHIVTLSNAKGYRPTLDDVVGLGAGLDYQWSFKEDSLRKMIAEGQHKSQVFFNGLRKSIWFVTGDSIRELPLEEGAFYSTGRGDTTTGFRVKLAFPDVAFLKAEPSSKSNQIINPVARVEVWKEGGAAEEAYLYPESPGRKAGKFVVSGAGFTLGLGYDRETTIQHCQCHLTIDREGVSEAKSVKLEGKGSQTVFGYTMALQECMDHPQKVSVSVSKSSGFPMIIAGLCILALAGLVAFGFKAQPGQRL
jgi:hypothetical protein